MSWREILGGIAPADTHPNPQNPHNPQNPPHRPGFEDIEDFENHGCDLERPGPGRPHFEDFEDIGEADTGGGASLDEALAEACHGLDITPAEVRDALAPEDIEDWHKGKLTRETLAAFARSLSGRMEIAQPPAPEAITCATCSHFRRYEHPHLGICAVGVTPGGAAGLWDMDSRYCERYLPKPTKPLRSNPEISNEDDKSPT